MEKKHKAGELCAVSLSHHCVPHLQIQSTVHLKKERESFKLKLPVGLLNRFWGKKKKDIAITSVSAL